MELQPNDSYRQCIVDNCQNLPTAVLKGRHHGTRHDRRLYIIQIMHCSLHLTEAQKFTQEHYPRVTFTDLVNPRWLGIAQIEELNRRKT